MNEKHDSQRQRHKDTQQLEVEVPGAHCVLCITRLMRVVPSRMAGTIPAAQPNIARITSRAGIVQRMPDREMLVSGPCTVTKTT